jgi:hypothetical protein
VESPHVYDKGKYHYDSVEEYGLPESHAYHHTVYFLRWLIDNDLMSEEFNSETAALVEECRAGRASVLDVYEHWDCCLIDDMLSPEGNGFAKRYFDFEKGKYLSDYTGALQGTLPSEFHIDYNEANYQILKPIIDGRYANWKAAKK